MADLGYTNAQWTRFSREESFFLRLARVVEDLRRRFKRERTQLINWGDYNSNFTVPHDGNTLSGVVYGTNTSEDGWLYVEITGGPTYTVNLYTATSQSGLVATGSGTASSTVTLAAANSSGLTGTVRLAASVSTEADDIHQIRVFQDFKGELLDLWPSNGTTDDDASSRDAASNLLNRLNSLALSMQGAIKEGLAEWALTAANNPTARGNAFLKSADTSLLREVREVDASGAVSRVRTGFWETQRAAQADETTGSTQDIVKRVVAATSGTFDSNNDGSGTIASHTPDGHCPIGTWTGICTKGLGNSRGGTEEFDGYFQATDSDLRIPFTGIRVGQSWKGPRGFGPIQIVRSLTKTGDAGNADVGAASTFSASGESETNTDGGVVYGTVAANGSNWNILFYKSSNRASGDLVAQATNVATAASSQTASAKNGSGLTIVFNVGSGPTDTNTFSIDLNFFSIDNSSNVPDKFTITTSLTSSGAASRLLAEVFDGAYMNGDTAGAEQITDDYLVEVGTFVPYMKEDV